jgi:hypothetical protein
MSTAMLRYQVARLDGMLSTGAAVKAQIAERTFALLVCMNLSAAWALHHKSVMKILPRAEGTVLQVVLRVFSKSGASLDFHSGRIYSKSSN